MPILKPMLLGVVLPAGVTLCVLLIGTKPWRKAGALSSAWVAPVAAGAGFVAAFVALFGAPGWPPREHWMRLVYAAAAAVPVAWLSRVSRAPTWVTVVAGVTLAAGVGWWIVPTWEDLATTRSAWIVGAGVAIVSVWLALAGSVRSIHPAIVLLCLFLVICTESALMLSARNGKFAQLAGVLGAVVGAGFVLAVWRRQAFDLAGLAPIAAVVIVTLALSGRFYDFGGVPEVCFVLVAVAPVWTALGAMVAERHRTWLATLILVAVTALPLGFALLMAMSGKTTAEW